MNAEDCIYINTFGIINNMDQKPLIGDPKKFAYRFNYNNFYGETIYLKTRDVEYFFQKYANKFKNPFILVTGADVLSVPKNINNFNFIINHPKLIKWFAQNYEGNDNYKIKHLPLGLDYHTLYYHKNHKWGQTSTPTQQEYDLIQIKQKLQPIQNIISHIALANFQHSTYGEPKLRETRRMPILNILKKKSCIKFLPYQDRLTFWNHMNNYAFVISPIGYGLDTHRTYEILILGRIPIICDTKINQLYDDLPILIVSDWNMINENWLQKQYINIVSKWNQYNWDKLKLEYWLSKIKILNT
jgi:hypothetical protein